MAFNNKYKMSAIIHKAPTPHKIHQTQEKLTHNFVAIMISSIMIITSNGVFHITPTNKKDKNLYF